MQFDEFKVLGGKGKFFVRIALYVTDKAKFGSEGKVYSLDQIKGAYLQDLSEAMGTEVRQAIPIHSPRSVFSSILHTLPRAVGNPHT